MTCGNFNQEYKKDIKTDDSNKFYVGEQVIFDIDSLHGAPTRDVELEVNTPHNKLYAKTNDEGEVKYTPECVGRHGFTIPSEKNSSHLTFFARKKPTNILGYMSNEYLFAREILLSEKPLTYTELKERLSDRLTEQEVSMAQDTLIDMGIVKQAWNKEWLNGRWCWASVHVLDEYAIDNLQDLEKFFQMGGKRRNKNEP